MHLLVGVKPVKEAQFQTPGIREDVSHQAAPILPEFRVHRPSEICAWKMDCGAELAKLEKQSDTSNCELHIAISNENMKNPIECG